MRRLLLLLATTCILVTQGAAEPANPGPWTVSDISKSDSHRHAKLATGDTPGPLKYLHLGVRFAPNAADRQLHKFQVVDSKGKPVGDLFGADPKTSQLVFERETPWSSLDGLYLQGQGIRVPLFATQPVQPAPTTVVQPTPAPSPVMVDQPRIISVPPVADSVVPVTPTYDRTVVVEEPRERVVVRSVDRDVDLLPSPDMEYEEVVRHVDTHREVVHHSGSAGGGVGGGGGHGHGGGGGDGCPYGDDCPICGKNAKESLDALDPWAFDESARGRYDDLLARIENSGAALNLGSPGKGGRPGSGRSGGRGAGPAGAAGPGAGIGAGSGSGLGVGQSGGPLPGMAPTGSGTGSGLGRGPGLPGMGGPGAGPGSGSGGGPGAGPGSGGPGPGMGAGSGPGLGSGSGEGQGPGPGEGQGPGPQDGAGPGPEERFGAPGQGGPGQGPGGPGQGPGGPGPGAMAGPVEGAPSEPMPMEPMPNEPFPMDPNNPMNPMMNGGPGGGGGGGGNTIGPRNLFGPRVVNLADPLDRFHNLAPEVDLPRLRRPVLDVYGYRPTYAYFDPRFRFDPRIGQPGYGGGGGGGGGGEGYGAGGRYDGLARTGLPEMPKLPELLPEIVLYISAGNDGEEGGKIYQVNDRGRVLGIVNLPYQATGLALHRDDGLIAVTPRDRGKIYRVDDRGMLSVIMENNSKLPHPVDVGVAGDSDTIVVADSMADVLVATSIVGTDPMVYERFESAKYDDQTMSVAVTRDMHVMYGTNAQNGIYRFGKDKDKNASASRGPILPGSGGVAADPKSLKWAATQSPNLIHVYEGEMPVRTFKLNPGRSIYRQGLLSFAPSGAVVVATRPSGEVDKDVWLLAYETAEGKEGQILSLFEWDREQMLDFVVGPRMIWEGHNPSTYESKY